MSTPTISELIRNGHFIRGIYNYCDRWCERCPQRDRCLVAAHPRWPDDGIAPDPADDAEEIPEKEWADLTSRLAAIRSHPLQQRAEAYARRVGDWIATLGDGATSGVQPALEIDEVYLSPERMEQIAGGFGDSLEAVLRYRFLICTKLFRALYGLHTGSGTEEECGLNDADGSAKIALLALDDSTEAWLELRPAITTDPDWIVETLFLLDCLRIETESLFPDARAFQRPGFDFDLPSIQKTTAG